MSRRGRLRAGKGKLGASLRDLREMRVRLVCFGIEMGSPWFGYPIDE